MAGAAHDTGVAASTPKLALHQTKQKETQAAFEPAIVMRPVEMAGLLDTWASPKATKQSTATSCQGKRKGKKTNQPNQSELRSMLRRPHIHMRVSGRGKAQDDRCSDIAKGRRRKTSSRHSTPQTVHSTSSTAKGKAQTRTIVLFCFFELWAVGCRAESWQSYCIVESRVQVKENVPSSGLQSVG